MVLNSMNILGVLIQNNLQKDLIRTTKGKGRGRACGIAHEKNCRGKGKSHGFFFGWRKRELGVKNIGGTGDLGCQTCVSVKKKKEGERERVLFASWEFERGAKGGEWGFGGQCRGIY